MDRDKSSGHIFAMEHVIKSTMLACQKDVWYVDSGYTNKTTSHVV